MFSARVLIPLTLVALAVSGCGSDAAPQTWLDTTSGITWTIDAAPSGLAWSDAAAHCTGLGLDGRHDWRLPTISELRTLVRSCPATAAGGACMVADGCLSNAACSMDCDGCTPPSPDFCYWPSTMGGVCDFTWSASTQSDYPDNAWGVFFNNGQVGLGLKANVGYVRCVHK